MITFSWGVRRRLRLRRRLASRLLHPNPHDLHGYTGFEDARDLSLDVFVFGRLLRVQRRRADEEVPRAAVGLNCARGSARVVGFYRVLQNATNFTVLVAKWLQLIAPSSTA